MNFKVFSESIQQIILDNVTLKRIEYGVHKYNKIVFKIKILYLVTLHILSNFFMQKNISRDRSGGSNNDHPLEGSVHL